MSVVSSHMESKMKRGKASVLKDRGSVWRH